MSDVDDEATASCSDDRQLFAFRDNLRDNAVCAKVHGVRGVPTSGTLQLLEDKVTVRWQMDPWPFTKYVPLGLLHYVQVPDIQFTLSDLKSVRTGRQTTNFVRTLKYVPVEAVPANDDLCLSLCCSHATDDAKVRFFDLEFRDKTTRDVAKAFFRHQAQLHAEDEPTSYSDIHLPSGLSTTCYQLSVHPSFQLGVFLIVVGSMVAIGAHDPMARGGMPLVDTLLLFFLTLEQLIKVIGLEGFATMVHNKWDAFEFVIVAISWLAVVPVASLRGWNLLPLRIFRGVRLFTHWPRFQETLDTFLVALPLAWKAVLCYTYYLVLFAILGMYLFGTSLSHRCALATESEPGLFTEETGTYVPETPVHFCTPNAHTSGCKGKMECVFMVPPDWGYTGFHSFQASFLTVFLITLRSGFGPALDGTQQATSYFALVYFIGLLVVVSYMILSLFVGIVRESYITVSIRRTDTRVHQDHARQLYLAKKRVQFPQGTETCPDLVQWGTQTYHTYRAHVLHVILHSFLFTRPDDTFLSWCRLRHDRIFFLLDVDSPLMDKIARLADSPALEHFMNVIVFFNSILFALEYHGMDATYATRLYTIENVLVLIYGVEFLVLAAAAHGLVHYLQNPWNRLDFFLLVVAALEGLLLATSLVLYTDSYARGIFVLRLFRLVRPFRVVRHNNRLLLVLDAILASLPAFLSSMAFFLLLNTVFAVVGMNVFDGTVPPAHFATFRDSMLTLLKFANGASIWPIFHASLHATSVGVALVYYLTYVVLCRFLALNFMLVVLLRNFAMKGDERRKTLSGLFQDRMFVLQRIHRFDLETFVHEFGNLYHEDVMNISLSGSPKRRVERALSASEAFKARLLNVVPTSDFLKLKGYYGTSRNYPHGRKYRLLDGQYPSKNLAVVTPMEEATKPTGSTENPTREDVTELFASRGFLGQAKPCCNGHWLLADVSLFVFPPQSWVRLQARRWEKETEKYIFGAIVLRTIMLTVQSPLYSTLIQEFTTLSDVVYACILFFEFAVKVIARGFFLTPQSYLSNTWNQINLVVLLACALLLLLPHSTMISLFRLGRAFGPIRVFYRVRTFRVITAALKESARPIFYCVVLSLFVFYSFATLGMQIFGGRFAYCNDLSIDSKDACVGVFQMNATHVLTPRVWGNLSGLHFDTITGAMASIFYLLSMKKWVPVVNSAMDFIDETEVTKDHPVAAIASTYLAGFFVAFLFFTRFYLLKVFAGILINNFRCYNGTLLLTTVQLLWFRKKQAILALRPKYPLPTSRFMQVAQGQIQTRGFRGAISTIVLVHTSVLAWYRAPLATSPLDATIDSRVWWLHYVFSLLYAFDAVVRVAAVGWRDFVLKGFTWRTFNTCTAFLMLVGPLVAPSPVLLILGMTRAFDFKHLSLVLDRSQALGTLFQTLLASVPLILKVTLLLGYVLFVFAIVGVQVFSLTRWANGLTANLNLTTFPSAYATFVKFAAGEDWYATYVASRVAPPQCVAGRASSDCGSPVISALFYNSFYVLVVLVLQNLYASTMVDTYVLMSARADAKEKILGFQAADLHQFQKIWSEFDTDALGLVHKKHLWALLNRLDPPLGLGTFHAMRARLATEDMTPDKWHALSLAVHQRRREMFHDIEARLAELTYRVRLGLGTSDGLTGNGNMSPSADLTCPVNMVRFTDVLLVVTMRVVPLESLTVPEKVDELAMRGYAFRHRRAIMIQSSFRMYRTRRRIGARLRRTRRASQGDALEHVPRKRYEHELGPQGQGTESVEVIECEQLQEKATVRMEKSVLITLQQSTDPDPVRSIPER